MTNFERKTANTIQKFKIHRFDPPARLAALRGKDKPTDISTFEALFAEDIDFINAV